MALIPRKNRSTGLESFWSWPKEMESLFSTPFSKEMESYFGNLEKFSPSMDVSETNEGFKVTMEVPGMNEEELDLTFNDNTLVVKGEKREEKKSQDENFHHQEIRYGSFIRTLPFYANIDEDGIEASFKNGVLTVSLKKSEDTINKTRKIKIN